MIIDGVFASEAIDSSGEILDIKGCDISDLEQGLGVLNWEHRGDDAAGASANDIIGKVVFAKKIFGPDDCTDERQLKYWQQVKLPMIYGICRLFDGSGHPGAIAAAAMIRDYQKNGEPLLIRYSIEGTTLSKDKSSNRLLESVARRIAATIKPCNKSCHSGLIADPNDPSVKKKEHAHPNFTPLGGSMEIETAPVIEDQDTIRKALEAGSYGGAPGTLTGGSALQVEDRGLRNRLKAAVRDWDRVTPFKKFLKHRLPEASDTFIDRFSDLVGDYTIKKAQRQVLKDAIVKKAVEKMKQRKAKSPAPATPEAPAPSQSSMDLGSVGGNLTIRGQQVPPNPQIVRPHFDEKKGILHTSRGSFPIYVPSRDKDNPDAGQKFHNIMNDPKINQFHDYAMENWTKLHQRLKAGTLPPEVIMHGVLFSQLSPNTPVPMQELMYSHLVDAMHAKQADPRVPGSFSPELKMDWLQRDQPQKWPDHSREHFRRLEDQLRLKRDSVNREGKGPSLNAPRKAGDIGRFMLASNKFKNMSRYHELHNSLVDLVGRHRQDARSAVEELMHHKAQSSLWEARRKRELDKGRGDIGSYTAGPDVPGLAPKTARYTMGMLGGGNVVVPDTHFARYLFGLDRDKDAATIAYLRNQVLWNENNSHIMSGIDRFYGQNHDAVQHMLQHPKWGGTFEKPEDAIFPAFWKNWVGIVPHEATRGMKTHGFNESTDHRPFWEAIDPYLNKSEEGEDEAVKLAKQTAKTHAEWVEKYGEMPAMLMYFHFLVPKLLEGTEKQEKANAEQASQPGNMVVKFENNLIELNELLKAQRKGPPKPRAKKPAKNPVQAMMDPSEIARELAPQPDPKQISMGFPKQAAPERPKFFDWHGSEMPQVKFNNKNVKVGRASRYDEHGQLQRMALVDKTPGHYIAVPWDKLGQHGPNDIVKLPRGENGDYALHDRPDFVDEQAILDSDKHGIPEFVRHPETKSLVHGMNIDEKVGKATQGINAGNSYWAKSPNGKRAYVKMDTVNPFEMDSARREGLFHNLARDFFGLGDYVTPTAVVAHPKHDREMAIIQHVYGQHRHENPDAFREIAKEGEANGEHHKLAMLDHILSNPDRHGYNYLLGEDGKIKLIDNGRAFYYDGGIGGVDYLNKHNAPLHPDAAKWLASLDPAELDLQMRRHSAPEKFVRHATSRLKSAQRIARDEPGETIEGIFRRSR